MIIGIGFPSQESVLTKIGFIIELITLMIVVTRYIIKLPRKKY